MMAIEQVTDLDDERLNPFRKLRGGGGATGMFVVEGALLTERLMHSRFEIDSILTSPNHVDRVSGMAGPEQRIFVLDHRRLRELVGFRFHRGMLACAKRRPNPSLADLVLANQQPQTILACPLLADSVNLGSVLRIAAAFGATGCILGPHCADPFSRISLRVSMGAALAIPIRSTDNPLQDVTRLMRRAQFESMAAVLDPTAEPIKGAAAAQRTILAIGSEYEGLDEAWIESCDRRVTIPMQLGTDSLNVAIATGIILHQLRG